METVSVLTRLRSTNYLGSHPRATRRVYDVDIVFTDEGLVLRRGRREFGEIPWESVTELSAATWDTVERKISWPILVWFGWLWAFVFRTRTTFSYLAVKDTDGEWAFAVPDLTADELRSGLVALQGYLPNPSLSN
jgi:hypothetical protein